MGLGGLLSRTIGIRFSELKGTLEIVWGNAGARHYPRPSQVAKGTNPLSLQMGKRRLKKARILPFLTERLLHLRTVTSHKEVTCLYLERPRTAGVLLGALNF